jgi:hypothetical protein
MPSTTPERAARWPGGDFEALGHLRERGWKHEGGGTYSSPDRPLEDREVDAMTYLIQEWDFDWMNPSEGWHYLWEPAGG